MLTKRRADILSAGELSAGLTPLSIHALQAPAPLRIYGNESAAAQASLFPNGNDFYMYAEELIGAYGNFYREAQNRAAGSLAASSALPETPEMPVYRLFRNGTPINRLLTDPACRVTASPIVVALLLNIILWDYRAWSATTICHFLGRIRVAMLEEGLDVSGTLELFLLVLVTDRMKRKIEGLQRLWLLTRLLRVVNRLSSISQARLEETLLHFLVAGDKETSEFTWSPEKFRCDIIRDLDLSDEAEMRSCDV